MKLCVSMWSMHRKFYDEGWSVLDFLRFCSAHGIRHVELLDIFWRQPQQEIEQVQSFLREHGMSVGAYAVTNDFVHDDPERRNQALKAILAGMPVAEALQTRTLRVFAGDLKSGYEFENSLNYIVAGLRQACAEAERRGLTLALENHGQLAGRGDQVRTIIARTGSDCLKSTFDTGNFILVGQSSLEALEQLKPWIAHVHVKDFRKTTDGSGFPGITGERFLSVVCGEGEIPLPELLHRLSADGYNGYVSLEYEGQGDEAQGVLESLEFLRAHVGG
jgi:sugar phosphate isomerase/epimerase